MAALDAAAGDGRPGLRLHGHPALRRVLGPEGGVGRVLGGLWPGHRPVRAVAFLKDGDSNWGVPWHQDRVIAVRGRADLPGFGRWSLKAGLWHCEPPASVLTGMLFVRVHLDASTLANGAMEIALGSHRRGVVPASEAAEVAQRHPREACVAERGDVLVLKMLTLHRSGPSWDTTPRRVLRLDLAAGPLPAPLAWGDPAGGA